jgi:putative hydrolase of the HAD superfamily
VVVAAATLNQHFHQSFQAAPAPIFLETDIQDIPEREFNWWRLVVVNTFERAGVLNRFSDFSSFYQRLYDYFGTAEPWSVYPDVPLALLNWRRLGVELGVLSNFDSRLYAVLQNLGLKEYFTSITICTQVSAAKPDPQIFKIALEKHNCPPTSAWHIGDNIKDDYQGANIAGLRGIWINRLG